MKDRARWYVFQKVPICLMRTDRVAYEYAQSALVVPPNLQIAYAYRGEQSRNRGGVPAVIQILSIVCSQSLNADKIFQGLPCSESGHKPPAWKTLEFFTQGWCRQLEVKLMVIVRCQLLADR
jgi:hypothetical protein